MNEISAQHNDLVSLPLKDFTASELDILLAICYRCQNKGTNKVVLQLEDIRKLSHYKNKNEQQFISAIRSTNEKLIKLHFTIGDERKWTQFVLFPSFTVNMDEGTLTVRVAEEFSYMLNNLTGNFTRIELQESAALNSVYSKRMYKMLRRYRDWGQWKVSLEEFREYMDIPKSYQLSNIKVRIIDHSINELRPYFKNLKCKPYYDDHSKGRGRPKLMGYIFTFKKQPHHEEKQIVLPEKSYKQALSQQEVADRTGYTKTSWYCPRCHRPIYKKELEKNGKYFLYGHADHKTGGCNFKTFDVADLLRKEHLPPPELTEQQLENKKKLAKIVGGMFKEKTSE